nr:tRNA (adenosine(37)-N6)-threonylcarbamoyltransferase complex ATPase subunit type 1 TsaE [Dissulfurispira thermophila]
MTKSPSETEDIGFRLGMFLKKQKSATACLYGDLGVGKTTLIKGIASAFGIPERDIGSASFVIVAEYETIPPFYHIDLYRIEQGDELDNLGIWEYIESDGIAVIEWAERLSELPEDIIKVRMSYIDENSREVVIEGVDEKDWHNL